MKNIGVAVGQSITNTAYPLKAIRAKNGIPNWNLVDLLFKEWNPYRIIVGIPLNMDGTEQFLSICSRKFANKISDRFGVEVNMHDERLSTVEAKSILFEQRGFHSLTKKNIDSFSALIILESYFRQQSSSSFST